VRRSVAIGGALVAALAIAPAVSAAPSGGVLGWVEDSHGLPVAGAVVSLFGRGAGSSGLVTLTDSAGRFFVPSLPAGSYTLRALRTGHVPAPARKVVVLENQDATFTVSLTPLAEAAARAAEAKASEEAVRETEWLLRHKRRSVLEARGPSAGDAAGSEDGKTESHLLESFLADLDGTVEVMTSAANVGMAPGDTGEPGSLSLLQLSGRISDSGRWRVGGLVAERENTTWRMAAEFVVEPMEGHELRAATGYGSRSLRPEIAGDVLHDRGVGGVALQDRWSIGDSVTATVGGRFSYVGFMSATNHFDPSATVAYAYNDRTAFRGSFSASTLAPGGDILTINSLASAPAMNFAVLDDGLRAERFVRYELGMDQQLGSTSVGAFTYYEDVRDRLVNVFDGAPESRSLRIANQPGGAAARGLGVTVGRCFGDVVRGSMSYTYGRTQRDEAGLATHGDVIALAHPESGFHDFAARVETVIEGTDTRLVAYYRLNRLNPVADGGEGVPEPAALTNTRFDVQLSQGLPFLGSLTRADWDFLVAVRNLFYETSEGALLDEVAVSNPPKRVLGGISVRF
jgi:TonB-dependent receptor-like protein/carboxypeptidase family protein